MLEKKSDFVTKDNNSKNFTERSLTNHPKLKFFNNFMGLNKFVPAKRDHRDNRTEIVYIFGKTKRNDIVDFKFSRNFYLFIQNL